MLRAPYRIRGQEFSIDVLQKWKIKINGEPLHLDFYATKRTMVQTGVLVDRVSTNHLMVHALHAHQTIEINDGGLTIKASSVPDGDRWTWNIDCYGVDTDTKDTLTDVIAKMDRSSTEYLAVWNQFAELQAQAHLLDFEFHITPPSEVDPITRPGLMILYKGESFNFMTMLYREDQLCVICSNHEIAMRLKIIARVGLVHQHSTIMNAHVSGIWKLLSAIVTTVDHVQNVVTA